MQLPIINIGANNKGASHAHVAVHPARSRSLWVYRRWAGLLAVVSLFGGLGIWLCCRSGNNFSHNQNPSITSDVLLQLEDADTAVPTTSRKNQGTSHDQEVVPAMVKTLVWLLVILTSLAILLIVSLLVLVLFYVKQMVQQQYLAPTEQVQVVQEEVAITAGETVKKIMDSQSVAGRAEHFTAYLLQEDRGGETFTTRYQAIVSELDRHHIKNTLTSDQPEPNQDKVGEFATKLFEEIANEDAAKDPFNMVYLDAVWAIFILLGAVALYQWLPGVSPATMSLTRRIGSYVFLAYGIGSLASVALCLYNPDILSEMAYNFAELKQKKRRTSNMGARQRLPGCGIRHAVHVEPSLCLL